MTISWRTTRSVLRTAGAVIAMLLAAACQSSTVSGLHIRARPTTASPVVTSLGPSGTSVMIVCAGRGEPVHGETTWYRISRPQPGWVSAHYIRTDDSSTAPIGSC